MNKITCYIKPDKINDAMFYIIDSMEGRITFFHNFDIFIQVNFEADSNGKDLSNFLNKEGVKNVYNIKIH